VESALSRIRDELLGARGFAYLFAIAVTVAALIARTLLSPWLGERAPIILLVGPVMAAGWYGGFGPGMFATAIGAVAAVFLFRVPGGPILIDQPHGWARLLSFVGVGLLTSLMCGSLHRSRQRMRDSEERLRFALAAARLYAFDWDYRTGHVRRTENADALFGLNVHGTSDEFLDAMDPDDRIAFTRAIEAATPRDPYYQADYRITHRPSGERLFMSERGKVEFDPEGRPLRIVGVVTDVTDLKRAEEALLDADRRKDEFIAMLAHELRNPLAPITNAVQILRQPEHAAGAHVRAREIIERQVRHLTRLLDDLLDVSRITRGKLMLKKTRVELQSVVATAVESSRPLVDEHGHELVVRLPEQPVILDADPTRLAQIFLNLLNNAARYTDRGGKITLEAECEGEEVVVRVKDTGVGIPPEMLPRIFDMFTQVGRSLERAHGGLGIGLTLVRRLVDLHGGRIEARSEGAGKGSEFITRLPLAIGAAAEPSGTSAETAPRPQQTRTRRRVLVVDDNRESAESLAMLLQMGGHDVRTAYDGIQGIELASAWWPDVILMDIGMPRMNGYEAAQRIRAEPWGRKVRLIALTGWGQAEDRRRSAAAGFDAHLTKPIEYESLRTWLERPA
jgi:Osmosensitive K+ channel histidine kinase